MSNVPQQVVGPNLRLRLVRPEDAAYIHNLRTDPHLNRHLSEVRGTVEDQRRWIEAYKDREAAGHEVYYVIERHDGLSCGTVRLYGITADRFTWGSWILDQNKPPKAALESAVLSFGLGFGPFGRSIADVDVRRENRHAEAFYHRFGMTRTGADDLNVYFTYSSNRFHTDRPRHMAGLAGAA